MPKKTCSSRKTVTDAMKGNSFPLGATVRDSGDNFSVFSKNAEAVELQLFDHADDSGPSRTILLDPKKNKLSCLPGVGARLSGFVQSARDVPGLIVIDGCEIGCGKRVLEQAEIPLRSYLVITALGIDKNKDMNLKREEIDRVKEAVRRL